MTFSLTVASHHPSRLSFLPVPQDPYNLPALLSLGVSYVNELDSARALQNLKAWIEHNPKYQVTNTPHIPLGRHI